MGTNRDGGVGGEGDNRSVVYEEGDGTVVYRASGLYGCVKALVAARLGIDGEGVPEWLLERYDEGSRAEEEILNMVYGMAATPTPVGEWELLDPEDRNSYRISKDASVRMPNVAYGLLDASRQFTMEMAVGSNQIVRGHMDGVAELVCVLPGFEGMGFKRGDRAVVEVKHLATDAFEKFLTDPIKNLLTNHPYYAWQVSLYMWATGLPCLFTVAEKLVEGKGDERVYVGVGRVTTFLIDVPMIGMGVFRAKVAKVEKYAGKGELPLCDVTQFPCPVYFLHTEEDDRNAGRQTGVVDKPVIVVGEEDEFKIQAAIVKYTNGMALEKEGKEQKKEASLVLKDFVESRSGTPLKPESVVIRTGLGDVEWCVEKVEAGVVERKEYVKAYPKVGKAWGKKEEECD